MALKSTTVQPNSIYKYVIIPCVSSQTFTFNILKENTSQVDTVSYTMFTSPKPFEHKARLGKAEKMVCQKNLWCSAVPGLNPTVTFSLFVTLGKLCNCFQPLFSDLEDRSNNS